MYQRKSSILSLAIILAIVFVFAQTATAQTTAFNFQGRVNDGSNPANGRYDLEFWIYDAITAGNQVGATISKPNLMLVNGVFSTQLDFGINVFTGADRFMETRLRATGSGNVFVILGPRQQILSVPYTLRSTRATLADNATNAGNSDNFGGLAPTQFILNRTFPQTADFSVSGGGAMGGRLSVGGNGTINGNLNVGGNGIINGNVGIGGDPGTTKLYVAGRTKTNILEITGGSDLAEKFEISEIVNPGMIVAIDPRSTGKLMLARGAYNRRVAGVVSGANNLAAGMVLPDLKETNNAQPVALSGRVWVYCDATKNPVRPGDLLTTSSVPGFAMKITDYKRAAGATIGKAMTELKSGKGLVLVLVNLQ